MAYLLHIGHSSFIIIKIFVFGFNMGNADIYFVKLENADKSKIGSKARNLKLLKEKSPSLIPETLLLTTEFYNLIKTRNRFRTKKEISYKEVFLGKNLEDMIIKKIYEVFGHKGLVIRSSATCEDSPLLSFAGQYSTVLNIKGRKSIIKAIKMCISSMFKKNALIYAKKQHVNLNNEALAVMIQEFIPVDTAGVIFTMDPVNNNRRKMVLEYTKGLGDKVVSGEKRPILLVLDKRKYIGNNYLLKRIVNKALEIEKIFGNPRDIEWGIKEKDVYIFQSREITTKKKYTRYKSKGKKVIAAEPCSPGIAEGRLLIIDRKSQLKKIRQNDIVYFRGYNNIDVVEFFEKISGLIFQGGVLSHISVVAREFNIPAISYFKGNIEKYCFQNIFINGCTGGLYKS